LGLGFLKPLPLLIDKKSYSQAVVDNFFGVQNKGLIAE